MANSASNKITPLDIEPTFVSTPDSEMLNARIDQTLATMLYSRGVNSILTTVVTSSTLFLILDSNNNLTFLWWLAMSSLLLFRLIDILHWKKVRQFTEFNGDQHLRNYSIGVCLTAALWCSLPFMLFHSLSLLELATCVIFFAGLAGGATTMLSASKFTVIFYISVLLVPPSLYLLPMDSELSQTLGILGLLFWLVLLSSALKAADFCRESARLHHLNQDLLDAVNSEKDQAEKSNEKLQQAYLEINQVNANLESQVLERTERLNQLATIDELTGLKNRHTFVETLDKAIENANTRGRRFSILFIDLDGFKEINDIHGHLIGDSVLQSTTERLMNCVDDINMLCRWGGDEFVLVTEEIAEQKLLSIGKKILSYLERPIEVDDSIIEISSSIGIATYPDHGGSASELLNAADIAMYQVKNGKKSGCLIFQQAFLDAVRNEQWLREGIRNAIENNEIELHYQAILPTNKKDPVIYEALMRWTYGDKIIPPTSFIPIAESSGAINALGEWAIFKACSDISSGVLGSDSSIAVNISVKQILEGNLVETVSRALALTKLSPARLHLEITESFFATNLNLVAKVLGELRQLGIKISIDDFGTGFSSLAYLQALPVNTVKIDRSFVKKINEGGKGIIIATISIARTFNCEVIAEGVETREQYEELLSLGVNYLQGFYFDTPRSVTKIDSQVHHDIDLSNVIPSSISLDKETSSSSRAVKSQH